MRIILSLFDKSPLTVQEVQDHYPISSAKFFSILRDLRKRNIVRRVSDPCDKRRRRYELPTHVRIHICTELTRCAEAATTLEEAGDLSGLFEKTLESIGRPYGIDPFPFRFSMLLSLFRVGHWSPSEGLSLTDTSQVSFFSALEYLKSIGAVECTEDPVDRRKKQCQLTPAAHATFVQTVQAIKMRVIEYAAQGPCAAASG